MRGLVIAAIVLAVLWFIGCIRFGVRLRYAPEGLSVAVLGGPIKRAILPAPEQKPKPEKPEKQKKEKPKKEKPKKEPKPGTPSTLSRLLQLLPLVGEAAGSLPRRLRLDELSVSLLWGGGNGDPASAAIAYGQVNAVLGAIWPVLDNNFNVKKSRFHVDLDYDRQEPEIVLDAALTISLGQIVAFSLNYGTRALLSWVRSGRPAKE